MNIFILRQTLLFLALIVCSAVSSGGGLGGGSLYVPLFVAFNQISSKAAIPLSKCVIFGLALGTLPRMIRRRHPSADRPLIDFKIALLLEPMTLVGVSFGVLLNHILPTWLIDVLILIVLAVTVNKTLSKGMSIRKAERAQNELQERNAKIEGTPVNAMPHFNFEDGDGEARSISYLHEKPMLTLNNRNDQPHEIFNFEDPWDDLPSSASTPSSASVTPSTHASTPSPDLPSPTSAHRSYATTAPITKRHGYQLLKEDVQSPDSETARMPLDPSPADIEWSQTDRQVPWSAVFCLVVVSLLYLVFNILLGGAGSTSLLHIRPCSTAYWLLFFVPAPLLFALTMHVALSMRREHEKRQANGYVFLPTDPIISRALVHRLPFWSLVAGLVAGMLGLGGGVVKSPLMLVLLGMHPAVVVATSLYMITFTSFTSVSEFFLMGSLSLQNALLWGAAGLMGAIFGQIAVEALIQRWRMQSLVVFILVGVMSLGGLLLLILSTLEAINTLHTGKGWLPSLNAVCPS